MIDPKKLSDEDINFYLRVKKTILNPRASWIDKPGRQRQRVYKAKTQDGTKFRIFCRKSLDDSSDFSCGVQLICNGGKVVTLVRYNGFNHRHGNINFKCHIHLANAENIRSDKIKDECQAEETTRYKNFDQALLCLIEDCSVQTAT